MKILVIGRHPQIMETVLRLINSQPEWKAEGEITDQEAIEKFNSTFNLVLIGGGVEESSEKKLKAAFEKFNPRIKMIRHYGGGSGLLFNEIEEAIAK
ncbi:MAG: response regulator receiver protein [Flammeovirgaceae bacterium]